MLLKIRLELKKKILETENLIRHRYLIKAEMRAEIRIIENGWDF